MEKARNNLFDNIKGLLIFLMVLGHFLAGSKIRSQDPFFQWMWVVIYSFHIPVFIFISGYFSQKHIGGNGKALHRAVIYYGLGWALMCILRFLMTGKVSISNPLTPPFAMWYFLCLFTMRLLLPWLSGIRHIWTISLVLALVSGCINKITSYLSISRTISLLPFFLAGAILIRHGHIERLRRMNGREKTLLTFAWLILLGAFLYVMYQSDMNYDIVWAKASYHASGMSMRHGLLARGMFFLCAAGTGVMLFAFMPEKRCFLSKWGRNSLSVYLLHVVIYYALQRLIQHHPIPTGNVWLLTLIVLAVTAATVWLLSRDMVNRYVVRVIEIIEKVTWKGVSQ